MKNSLNLLIFLSINIGFTQKQDSITAYNNQKQYGLLNKNLDKLRIVRDSLENIINNKKSTKSEIRLANQSYDSLYEKAKKVNIDNIKKFPNSEYSLDLIYDLRYRLGLNKVKELFNNINTEIQKSANAEKLKKYIDLFSNHLKINDSYIDFENTDSNNQIVKLSDLRKGYTLIHFWDPKFKKSSDKNLDLKKVYNNFKSKDFEIVNIAISKNKSDWKKNIDKNKLPWPQLIDLKGWESEIGFKYGVNLVSNYCLIDKKGIIIYKDKSDKNLNSILKKILK